jgi:hypothetical protein
MSVISDMFYAEHQDFLKGYLRSYIKYNIINVFTEKDKQQQALVDLVQNWPIKCERETLEQIALEFAN